MPRAAEHPTFNIYQAEAMGPPTVANLPEAMESKRLWWTGRGPQRELKRGFSTLWKTIFHSVENSRNILPYRGKYRVQLHPFLCADICSFISAPSAARPDG